MRRTTLLALAFLTAVLAPATRADVDIIPERLTLRYVLPDAWDPQTGILHGTISGEAAGSGGVTVQIVPESIPRPTGLGRFPNTANRDIAGVWNTLTKLNRPARVFGPVSSSPFSDMLTEVLAQQGYLRVRLNRDLATVKVVKPSWPKTALDVCPERQYKNCCEVAEGADFACIGTLSYDAAAAATLNQQCATAGGVPCGNKCTNILNRGGDASCSNLGGTDYSCWFHSFDPPPYRCAAEYACATDAYGVPFANACHNNDGVYVRNGVVYFP